MFLESIRKPHRVLLVALPLAALLVAGALASVASAGPKTRVGRDRALVELGRRLFFDPAVSRSGANSCASCHDPEYGFSDPDRLSIDDLGLTRRHSQTLIDSHLNPTAHWDGEFRNIEELVVARLRPFGSRKGGLRSTGHGQAVSTPSSDGPTAEQNAGPRSPIVEEKDEDDDGGGGGGGGGSDDRDGEAAAPSSESGGKSSASPRGPDSSGENPDGECDVCGTPDQGGDASNANEKADAPKAADAEQQPADEPAEKAAPDAKQQPERWGGEAEEAGPTRDEVIRERFDASRLPRVADVIARGGRYDALFRSAFGSNRVTTQKLARAIAAYCASLESTEAPIDRYLAGDESALNVSARRGMALFQGRAGCASCHTMEGARPTFTDFKFHNTGVTLHDMIARDGKSAVRHRLKPDEGRAERSKRPTEVRAFKTPTLRDLTRRGPYMHTGRFETLEGVVRYYADGGGPDPHRSARVRQGFKFTDAEIGDLVAFLESLTGDVRPGLAVEPLPLRADVTRLRFVDARGRALAGLRVRLVPEADVLPAEKRVVAGERSITTDAKGWIRFEPSDRTHMRLVLPDGLPVVGGALVPDTCRKATVRVPVGGRVAIVLTTSADAAAPETLVAEHLWANAIPGHTAPRTKLRATRRLELGGARLVRYEGWLRTDVSPRVALRLPGDRAGRRAPELVLREGAELRLDLSR